MLPALRDVDLGDVSIGVPALIPPLYIYLKRLLERRVPVEPDYWPVEGKEYLVRWFAYAGL